MTDDEVRVAVQEVLGSLGFDTRDKFEMQRQMSSLKEVADLMRDKEFRADLIHLRKWRMATEKMSWIGMTTVLTLLITGIAGAIWLGLKGMLGK
jgi:hypothetical protein